MRHKIFVSYKYGDQSVAPLASCPRSEITTARHYVDELQRLLSSDHINKGEKDGEDLGNFANSTIQSILREKIFDSSLTIVIISKNMKELQKPEQEQWIPWEVEYSLKEQSRKNGSSRTNAMLAIVLPDENGRYDYLIEFNTCHYCSSTTWKTGNLFQVLDKNMFNRRTPDTTICTHSGSNSMVHKDKFHSYIHPVTWSDFMIDYNHYLELAYKNNEDINDFNITKVI